MIDCVKYQTYIVKLYLLLLLLLFISINKCKAQHAKNLDTTYYLADTAKVPFKDRIVEIGAEGPFKCFIIQISCLNFDQRPVFFARINDPIEVIKGKLFKKLQLISIIDLIKLAKDAGGEAFNYKHVAYILEPNKKTYIKRKVWLSKPMRHEIVY